MSRIMRRNIPGNRLSSMRPTWTRGLPASPATTTSRVTFFSPRRLGSRFERPPTHVRAHPRHHPAGVPDHRTWMGICSADETGHVVDEPDQHDRAGAGADLL